MVTRDCPQKMGYVGWTQGSAGKKGIANLQKGDYRLMLGKSLNETESVTTIRVRPRFSSQGGAEIQEKTIQKFLF